MSANNQINVPGALQGLLDLGFNLLALDGEMNDNALDAGAKNLVIDIYQEENIIIYSDDGNGMNKQELESSCVLYNRSEASNTKQGCKGVGRKVALANMTELQGKTNTYSKKAGVLNKLSQDWKYFVRTATYVSQTHPEISSRSEEEWATHAVNPSTGTVTIIETTEKFIREMYDAIMSPEINNSLIYHLGLTYRNSLNNDVKMTIKINGQVYKQVKAVDPLQLDNSEDKMITTLYLYVNNDDKNDKRIYFKNPLTEKNGYMSGKKKKQSFTPGEPPDNYRMLSSMEYRSVYHDPSEWNDLQKCTFDHISYKHPVSKNGKPPKKDQGTYAQMGGCFLTRSDKTLYRIPTTKKKSGDKDKYTYYDDARHECVFPIEADGLFKIQINKSRLDESCFEDCFISTAKFLENAFSALLIKKYCNKNDNKETYDSSSDEEIEIRAPKIGVRSVPPPPVVASNHEENDDRYADASSVSDSDSGDENEAVDDKINLELVNNVPVDNSTGKYDLEHESDLEHEIESSGEENDSDSATTRDVGPSEHLRYSAKGGKSDMKKWFESGEHAPELDTLVEELIQKYKTTISQADMKEIFSYMSREKKFEWIMKLITDKYPIDTDDMLKGCEVYRAYHEVFPHE
jgi:hypothetical protein